jgi:hypothetical protein
MLRAGCVEAYSKPSYRPSGEMHHPTWPPTKQHAVGALQFSCRWRQRRTVKRNRNRGPHHFEQYPHPSGLIQPLEHTHEVGKRAGQDPNLLPLDEIAI